MTSPCWLSYWRTLLDTPTEDLVSSNGEDARSFWIGDSFSRPDAISAEEVVTSAEEVVTSAEEAATGAGEAAGRSGEVSSRAAAVCGDAGEVTAGKAAPVFELFEGGRGSAAPSRVSIRAAAERPSTDTRAPASRADTAILIQGPPWILKGGERWFFVEGTSGTYVARGRPHEEDGGGGTERQGSQAGGGGPDIV